MVFCNRINQTNNRFHTNQKEENVLYSVTLLVAFIPAKDDDEDVMWAVDVSKDTQQRPENSITRIQFEK